MDDDFFDFGKDFSRTIVKTGVVNGRINPDDNFVKKEIKRMKIGNEYAMQHELNAQKDLLEHSLMEASISSNKMNELVIDKKKHQYKDEILDIYSKFNFDHVEISNLPICSEKFKILDTIDKNSVVILQGATGCGKTTQVPQFILDDAKVQNKHCNIIITQPRRIAAVSIANRVCAERNWKVGELVGYQVGLHANLHSDTRVLYCTTGILLQKLINTKTLSTYTHIILDEVHERDSEMDFLFIVIRKLLPESLGKIKIILMSATIDAMEFADFFKTPQNGVFRNAPIINVDRKSVHSVKEFYLCQLERLKIIDDVNYDDPGISDETYKVAIKLVMICERFDEQEGNEFRNNLPYKPSILIFLPGIHEIETMYKKLEQMQFESSDVHLSILPLHSSITYEEQKKIFLPPPPNCRKVILSTNIAESSITVPDIKYVIDFCLTKSMVTDPNTNFTGLKMEWASKSSCRQRAGRAGRVMNGRVYRLVSNRFFDFQMSESTTPELLRCPLTNVVLKAKLLDMGSPHSILALAMNPPNLSDIGTTILILKEVGALYKTVNGHFELFDGDLTFLGRVMSSLPLDIRAAKLIVLGYIFNVLEDAITVAAGLSVRNIFATPFNAALHAYSQKLSWADGSGSDLFAILNAYKVWSHKRQQTLFLNDEGERQWAKRYYIQVRAMKELAALITEIKSRLKRFNIVDIKSNEKLHWTKKEKILTLKIIFCGAFYPHYFYLTPKEERSSFQELGGRDPCNTVYFKGMDPKYVGILYEKSIKEILTPVAPASELKVSFDNNSQKVFVTFLNGTKYHDNRSVQNNYCVDAMPGRVHLEIYKALKLSRLNGKHTLQVLSPNEAVTYAKNHNLGTFKAGFWHPLKKTKPRFNTVVPPLSVSEIIGVVPHIEHCNKFWFQPEIALETLKLIHDQLRPEVLVPFLAPSEVPIGSIQAAPFNDARTEDDDKPTSAPKSYFRCKILSHVDKLSIDDDDFFNVFFIDYGNSGRINLKELRRIDKLIQNLVEVPPCVFKCVLSGIQPSYFSSPTEIWTQDAIRELHNFTNFASLSAEIYSYVNGVASVNLKKGTACLNELLIQKGLAQPCEENYMSKADHEVRERRQKLKLRNIDISDDLVNEEEDDDEVEEVEPPPWKLCRQKLNLLGPCSPLETSLYTLMKFGEFRSGVVEGTSVNSILIDAEPQLSSNKLIVAAEIGCTKNERSLIARNTTIMPNIKGFDAIMALMFCPQMELNRDPTKTRFASFLTGLGYNPKTNEPLFEDHDMLFKLNVEITTDDLEEINRIRYFMETLLHTDHGQDIPKLEEVTIIQIMNKLKLALTQLFQKPRKSVEQVYSLEDYNWGKIKKSDALSIDNIYGERSIFPLHSSLRLNEPKEADLIKLRANCDKLHELTFLHTLAAPVECLLCNKFLENITQIRIHLYTSLHLEREAQIVYEKQTTVE